MKDKNRRFRKLPSPLSPAYFWLLLLWLMLGQTACVRRYLAHCEYKGKKIYREHLYLGSSIDLKTESNYVLTEDKDNLHYELETVIQQKPNQKILLFKPRMWAYIAADTLKRVHHIYCDSAGQHHAKRYPTRKRNKLGRWALRRIGERPVVLDTAATRRSASSMLYYLHHKGYFNAEVVSEIRYRRHKASVVYKVQTGKRFLVDSVFFDCQDSALLAYIESIPPREHPIRHDEPLALTVFDQEKSFLTEKIRNQGYFKFSAASLSFEADTVNVRALPYVKKPLLKYWVPGMQGEPRANIYIKVLPYSDTNAVHPRFWIDKVFIQVDENVVFSSNVRQFQRDTLYVAERINQRDRQPRRKVLPELRFLGQSDSLIQHVLFVRQRMRSFKPSFLARTFTIKQGQLYRADLFKENIRRMTEIDVFKAPRIDYLPSSSGDPSLLDCYIRFRPAEPIIWGTDFEVNNNNTNLGGSVNLNYRNRNVFRGGESFVAKIEGNIDFRLKADTNTTLLQQGLVDWINLLDVNAESSLYFPRFLGWSAASLRSDVQAPTTRLSLGYRYMQQANVFRVSTLTARFGYQWNVKKIHQFSLNPAQVNFALKPVLDPVFASRLAESNRALLASLQEQFFIPAGDFSYTYNNPDAKGNHTIYFKFYGEWAGNLLRLINLTQPNETFKIFGSDYSQYIKSDIDFRYSYRWSRKTNLVTRLLLGAALPFGETADRGLPFSRRFFMGGPSSMRAWSLRHLGPGRVEAVPGAEFQQGDIRIEWNFEYRRKLNSWVSLALFTDVGNVWLWKPETTLGTTYIPSRVPANGVFTKDFYKEMAVALGMGLRLDFSFFIFRLDVAMQAYNPAGYELMSNGHIRYYNYNPFASGLNNWIIGIGYPF